MPDIQPLIGGNHIKDEQLEETVEKLRSNRAVLVLPMNADANDSPELEQVQTIDDAFKNYKPDAEVELKTSDGSTTTSKVGFNKMTDFEAKNIVKAIPQLRDQATELAILRDLRMQLKDNVQLKRSVDRAEERQKLVAALQVALRALQG